MFRSNGLHSFCALLFGYSLVGFFLMGANVLFYFLGLGRVLLYWVFVFSVVRKNLKLGGE